MSPGPGARAGIIFSNPDGGSFVFRSSGGWVPVSRQLTAYLTAVLTWPVVYFLWLFLSSLLAAPFFLAPKKREESPRRRPTGADLFEALAAAASQVACLAVGKAVLTWWGREAGVVLVPIYAAWAFLMVAARGPMLGLPGRHGVVPDALGLVAGLGLGYLLLF